MRRRDTESHAMTLVEVVLAMAVLGLLLGSVAQAVTLSVRVQRSTAERVQGGILATELIEFIAAMPYSDPDGSTAIGIDAGELASDRSTFDDVDDFNGWKESPPLQSDGAARADFSRWGRSVTVEWVSLGSPLTARLADSGTKKITVTVTHNGRTAAKLDRLRSLGADSARE